MRKILMAMGLLLVTVSMSASKADPAGATITQPDGSQLTVYLHGDADNYWFSTADGALLVQSGGAYYVAQVDSWGQLSASKLLAHELKSRNGAELSAVGSQNLQAFRARNERLWLSRRQKTPVADVDYYMPHKGTWHVPVLLVQFSDVKFTVADPVGQFSQLLDSVDSLRDMGYGDQRNLCSVRRYYNSCSKGQFDPRFDVYGPYTVSGPSSQYVNSKDAMIREALTLADSTIDFTRYDQNGDNFVDGVYVIFAGYSAATSGNDMNKCIWPYANFGNLGTYDGKTVHAHCATNELIGFPGAFSAAPLERITGIGTFCHEFGHTLGLPDLYAASGSTGFNLDNQGLEYWSLMDGGEYVRNGYTPTALNAWEREALGYEHADTLTEAGPVELLSYDKGGRGLKMLNDSDATGREYILLENVQLKAVNSGMRGHGLVVYRVDYDHDFVNTLDFPNNTAGHPQITVLPADSLLMAQASANDSSAIYNAQIAGDPYPGTTGRDSIASFAVYHGGQLVRPIYNIVEADGKITFDYLHPTPTAIDAVSVKPAVKDSRVFNLSGQCVGHSLQGLRPGIYIQNNRKIIITVRP